ncbi:MAG: hypothetical protein ACK5MK_07320 [Dysgonomonas sp.]
MLSENKKQDQYTYKLEIDVITPVSRTVTKPFKTLKVLRQWQQRADIENNIYIFGYREYMLNPVTHLWERFTVFGTTIVLFSELEREYYRLRKNKEEQ